MKFKFKKFEFALYYNVSDSEEVEETRIKEISETIANTYKTATIQFIVSSHSLVFFCKNKNHYICLFYILS